MKAHKLPPSSNASLRPPGHPERAVGQGIRQFIDAALSAGGGFTRFEGLLAGNAIEVIPFTQMSETRLTGLKFRHAGEVFKGSDLGKAYSPKGLFARGLTYGPEDALTVRACRDREAARGFGSVGDRDLASEQAVPTPGTTERRVDRTRQAIESQTSALGTTHFEVGIRNELKSMMRPTQVLSRERLVRPTTIAWLKRENARGEHIYVRPHGEHSMVLVDDVDDERIKRMRADGIVLALIVETSIRNFQVWIRLSEGPQPPEVRAQVARHLERKYSTSTGSAGAFHYGRMAGFTNVKRKHFVAGRSPFVLVRSASGQTMPQGADLLELAIRLQSSKPRVVMPASLVEGLDQDEDLGIVYERLAGPVRAQWAHRPADPSAVDFHVATAMLMSHVFSDAQIRTAIATGSPHIEKRKDDIPYYTDLTIFNARRLLTEAGLVDTDL